MGLKKKAGKRLRDEVDCSSHLRQGLDKVFQKKGKGG